MQTGGIRSGGLTERMRWLQARSRTISENIAQADTPRYTPKDLAPAEGSGGSATGGLALSATQAGHIGTGSWPGGGTARTIDAPRFETRPNGNAVSLEDEMLKLSETQMEYQMMTGLYQRSLTTLKTALGRRS